MTLTSAPYAEAGLVLFCRPGGAFLVAAAISRLLRRDTVPLHWLIRAGSASMAAAFGLLFLFAHRIGDRGEMQGMIMAILLMQAGGGVGVFVPAQAILVARMPADRLASVTSIMQMLSGVTAMVGMVFMLALVRGWGVETDPAAYRPVWALSAALSVAVHAVGWTVGPGSQHKPVAAPSDGGGDGGGEAERAALLASGGGDEE
jgi:hypothetical protein